MTKEEEEKIHKIVENMSDEEIEDRIRQDEQGEEEAIEYIKRRIKVCNENADICDDNNFNEEATYLREESYMLETVLSMLKEKDAKIEHLEEKRNNQKEELAILNEKQKEMNKLINTVSSYKEMFKKLQKENKEKDKQTDLMINFMYETWCKYPGTISHALRRNGFNDDECGTCENTDKNCVKCIKQYFERKSEK